MCPNLEKNAGRGPYWIPLKPADETLRRASRVFLLLKSVGLIYALCFASAAFAQVRYQITRIPTAQGANSVALGINNKGEVVGYSFQGEDYKAFLYSSSGQSLTDVGSLGGKINAACAINDAGQVTGYSQDRNGNMLAFIYSRTQPIASLGTLDDASTSEAFGINSSGAVVGDSQSGAQNHCPVLFSDGSIQDLGIGRSNEPDALETAYAINDAGQIVGRHMADNDAFHAFVFLHGNTTDLGTLGGANGEALAINKNGQVVGDSDTREGPAHAFIFDHSELRDLGTLPGFENASYARGINNSGDIVGESDSADQKRAFFFTRGQLFELDKLAENLSEAGFTSLDVAYGISDKGRIVGYGTTTDNLTAAFVAVPEGRRNQRRLSGQQQPQEQPQAERPQTESETDQGQPISESNGGNYDLFYSRLSSDEGDWVEAGNYGYCFRPRVSEDWRPYQDGHWVWTDRGWYWDSNERFAWATYHYGRWVDISGTGWCWTPGNQWAPAWVSWRQSDEDVGWAPLPPEADASAYPSISSWSDSYYGIGPAAYVFINYSHWHERSYAQYIEPPQRNVQIINETKNVTNIVTNNNVINNLGPPVQTIATKTNQNIQQVKLAISPVTDPKANYGQTLQGNQLKVVAPPVTLSSQATHAPPVQNRIANPQVEKGWQGVKPQDAEKLRKTIAEQNPPPKDLPRPTPFAPQIGNKGQVTGFPGAPGSPAAAPGQKTPPNLLKPSVRSPNANVTPNASLNTATAGKKLFPPNLLVAKPSGTAGAPPKEKRSSAGSPNGNVTPSASPSTAPAEMKPVPPNLLGANPSERHGALPPVKTSGTLGGSPPEPVGKPTTPGSPVLKSSPSANVPGGSPSTPRGTPPNLIAPRPATTPGQPESQPNRSAGGPTPKPTGNLPPGQNRPHASAAPRNAVMEPTLIPQAGPVATPKPAAEVKAAAPKQEIKTPPPQAHHAPAPPPQVHHAAAPPPQVHHAPAPPPQVHHAAAPPPQVHHAPAPPPQVHHAAAPPPQVQHAAAPPPQVHHAAAPPPQVQHAAAPPPQVHHAAAPPPQVQHAAAPPPQVQHAPAPPPQVQHAAAPPPQVQHAPAPPPQVQHAPAPPPQVQHAPAPPPQGGQKREPAKGKPTPAT